MIRGIIGLNAITKRVQRSIYGLIQPALLTCFPPLFGNLWLPAGCRQKVPPEVENDIIDVLTAQAVEDILKKEDEDFVKRLLPWTK